MANNQEIESALLMYARESSANIARITQWRDAALASVAAGNGGDFISGSGNGMSFTKNTQTTNLEWFKLTQFVLDRSRRGNKVRGKSRAIFF